LRNWRLAGICKPEFALLATEEQLKVSTTLAMRRVDDREVESAVAGQDNIIEFHCGTGSVRLEMKHPEKFPIFP
jgi:hypothetical protein